MVYAGSLRTLRNQSGTNGSRTLGSILASDASNGAGAVARMAKWYAAEGPGHDTPGFFVNILNIRRGSLFYYDKYVK